MARKIVKEIRKKESFWQKVDKETGEIIEAFWLITTQQKGKFPEFEMHGFGESLMPTLGKFHSSYKLLSEYFKENGYEKDCEEVVTYRTEYDDGSVYVTEKHFLTEKEKPVSPCVGCKYYRVCGDPDRECSCKGKVEEE